MAANGVAPQASVVSRGRPAALPTSHNGAPAPKGRVSLMQLLGCGMLVAMSLVVVYMYRIIDQMHHDQQAMRLQLAELSGAAASGGTGLRPSPHLRVPQAAPVAVEMQPPLQERQKEEALLASKSLLSSDRQDAQQRQRAESKHGTEGLHAASGGASKDSRVVNWPSPGSTRPRLQTVDSLYYTVGGEDGREPERRKLSFMATVGTSATDGCYTITDSATVSFDVSSATECGSAPNTHPCPDCFVTDSMSQDIALTISTCSSASWIRGQTRSGVWTYTFVNSHATYTLSVTDDSGSGKTTYNIPPGTYIQGYCASSVGTSNRMYFPSYQLPTLTVDSGITMSAGNFDGSSSTGTFATSTGTNTMHGNVVIDGSKTFATGTGTVSLNGATTVADSTTFTVGSAGNGGASTLYGDVNVGGSSNTVTMTLYGNFDQQGSSATFSTSDGVVSLNGDIEVAAGKDFAMLSGTGTFTTGSGTVSLLGDTAIAGSKTFTTGTGTVSLMGDVTVDAGVAVTIGTTSTAAGTTTIYGPVVIGGSSSGQSQSLTLYGDFTAGDGADGAQTFTTATGAITLNGDVTVSADNNLHMTSTSTGTFQTGAGLATFYGSVTQSGSGTFTTGTGAVSLNGATSVADDKSFSVGSPGSAGASAFYGITTVGGSASGASTTFQVYGGVTFSDDTDGTTKDFTVASTGTSTFKSTVYLDQDVNFEMHSPGTGTFKTAAGAVSLRGDTTVTSPRTFTIADQGAEIGCSTHSAFDGTIAYCFPGR